jgi:type IV pilus assembly protein PilE
MRGFEMSNQTGVTLPEVMVTIAIVGILAGIALPSYQGYIQRSTLSEAFDGLSAFRMRMDQAFNNNGNFGAGGCAVAVPAATANFSFACELTNGGQGYLMRADGAGRMAGYAFSVDDAGRRVTLAFPGQPTLPANCWVSKQGEC